VKEYLKDFLNYWPKSLAITLSDYHSREESILSKFGKDLLLIGRGCACTDSFVDHLMIPTSFIGLMNDYFT
jgi:hypothetical protein